MAFLVRISAYGHDAGKPLLALEPSWWPARELRNDPRFVESVGDGYLDYSARLSVTDACELHEKFKPRAFSGLYADKAWQAIIRSQCAELDAAFAAGAGKYSHFTVRIMEWESGLG
jgi:hypothetical protein